jgi:hypothetical protein
MQRGRPTIISLLLRQATDEICIQAVHHEELKRYEPQNNERGARSLALNIRRLQLILKE